MSAQATPQPSQIGELFGYPIPALFFRPTQGPITDSSSSDSGYLDGERNYAKVLAFFTFVQMSPNGEQFAERILLQLDRAESKAHTATERDDIRTAWMTVNLAFYHNYANPYFTAFCRIFGQTPEKMQQQIDRYEAFMLRNEVVAAIPPKKQPQSVKFLSVSEKRA